MRDLRTGIAALLAALWLLVSACGGEPAVEPPSTTLPPPLEAGDVTGRDLEAVLTEVGSAADWPHIAYTLGVLPSLDLGLTCSAELLVIASLGDEDSVVVMATATLAGEPVEVYWMTSDIYVLAPDDACARR